MFNFFISPKSLVRWEGLFLVLITTLIFSYGYFKISPNFVSGKTKIQEIGIVQPNITPEMKWSKKYIGYIKNVLEIQTKFVNKKISVSNKKRKLIIWPEASLPLVLRDKSNWTEWIKKLVVLKKTYLLFGALGHSPNDDNKELYNSVFLFDSSGTKIARYDKKHLVPFGEYVPFKDYLFFVNKLIASCILFSVSASSEDVASSRRIIGVFFSIALAIESLCFSPPDNRIPFSPIIVS